MLLRQISDWLFIAQTRVLEADRLSLEYSEVTHTQARIGMEFLGGFYLVVQIFNVLPKLVTDGT